MNRTVEVPAKGKREAFTFVYDAKPVEQASKDELTKAWFAYQDHEATLEHTTAAKEAAMLSANFYQTLKFLSRSMGSVDKALPILLQSGGFESLTEDEVNAAVEKVKNPPARKKRTKKESTPEPQAA